MENVVRQRWMRLDLFQLSKVANVRGIMLNGEC